MNAGRRCESVYAATWFVCDLGRGGLLVGGVRDRVRFTAVGARWSRLVDAEVEAVKVQTHEFNRKIRLSGAPLAFEQQLAADRATGAGSELLDHAAK